jgi:hypothetical protein
VVTALPVALFVIEIFAPTTTAPLESVTVPTMLPVLIVVCARRAEETRRIAAAKKTAKRDPECLKKLKLEFDTVHLPCHFP